MWTRVLDSVGSTQLEPSAPSVQSTSPPGADRTSSCEHATPGQAGGRSEGGHPWFQGREPKILSESHFARVLTQRQVGVTKTPQVSCHKAWMRPFQPRKEVLKPALHTCFRQGGRKAIPSNAAVIPAPPPTPQYLQGLGPRLPSPAVVALTRGWCRPLDRLCVSYTHIPMRQFHL